MSIWVRSQDKEFLMKVDNINLGIDVDTNEPTRIFTFVDGTVTSFTLGTYNSKERAIEVLDEIQEGMIKNAVAKVVDAEKQYIIPNPVIIYEMPEA